MDRLRYKRIRPDAKKPILATDGSAGYDVFASVVLDKKTLKIISDLREPIEIKPGESVLFGIGVALEIPKQNLAVMASRSGLERKYGIELGYHGAPIDPDYRGEVTVILWNRSKESFIVGKNMRIAQVVFLPRIIFELIEAKRLSRTKRGKKGLGSTGLY